MSNDLILEPAEHDMLLEATSVAAGKIVGSVANITTQKVDLDAPDLRLELMEKVADSMGPPGSMKTVVYVKIIGQANGAVLLVINPDHAEKLIPGLPTSQKLSAVEEITNIVGGTALGALSKLLGMTFLQSVPHTSTGMLRAIINEVVTNVGMNNAQILSMVVSLKVGEEAIPVPVYLLFDNASTASIIQAGKALVQSSGSGN